MIRQQLNETPHKPEKQKGFTLVEVLIAITIFAIGLLAIAGMQLTGIQTNSSASEITARAALAEGILEEILSWDLDDERYADAEETLTDWPFVIDVVNPANNEMTHTVAGAGRFTATYIVLPDDPINGVFTVQVTVTSDTGRNAGRTTTITSIRRG